MMRLVLLGPPGAGKGTQAQFLTGRLAIPKISTGEMLRQAADRGTPLGVQAQRYISRGELVPDDLVVSLVEERLQEPDVAAGFLLDGFPRTLNQAETLDEWLASRRQELNAVVDLQVPDDVIVDRLAYRVVCSVCQAPYHLLIRPPRTPGVCDVCGSPLEQRADDPAGLVRERLRVYHERTAPVTDYYRDRGLLVEVDGELPVPQVTDVIVRELTARVLARS